MMPLKLIFFISCFKAIRKHAIMHYFLFEDAYNMFN